MQKTFASLLQVLQFCLKEYGDKINEINVNERSMAVDIEFVSA